ncbi:MAG: IS200/IS605 family element transposase accessory protein TnpB [Symploca sp. SIO2D2]|nr:IS200/IS605 family element transposase accessory protein TnpB [Symploca sp. SIO2D2]
MYGCQQILLHPDKETQAVLEFICSEVNKLTNCGIYYARQLYFKTKKFIGKYTLDKELKSNWHFKALRANVAQQALHKIYDSFKGYQTLIKKWWAGELDNKPRLPNYRKKGGLEVAAYPAASVKCLGNKIRLGLGRQVKAWFGLDNITIPLPSNLDFKKIKEIRILPRNNCFYTEFVYQIIPNKAVVNYSNALGIDPGLNNWLTCVSTTGKSFIIDGKKVKSQNQWYHKRIAAIKKGGNQDYWDSELDLITEKRNRQMRDAINKAARFMINWCLRNDVCVIVFGWNKRNKDSINIGHKNNQEFVIIPTARLKDRIEQLAIQYGLKFIETEESYTSKASFLDQDVLPKFGEKPNQWKPTGKKGKKGDALGRGQYQTEKGTKINSDCNGAANILRKVSSQLKLSLVKVRRVVLSLPKRYDLTNLSKSYRKQSEERGFNPL